jgi:hypothetical protein
MFKHKKIYFFHLDEVKMRLNELKRTGKTLCKSLFIRELLVKECLKLNIEYTYEKVHGRKCENYSYCCTYKDKNTRNGFNEKLIYRDFIRGHWKLENVLESLNSHAENPDNLTKEDIIDLFNTKNINIISSLVKCYKTPLVSMINYYKLYYLFKIIES